MEHSSSVATEHLLPDWLERLLEDCQEEAIQHRIHPVILIKGESRVAVWNLCAQLGFKNHELPGQACRILERYLSIVIAQNYMCLNREDWVAYRASLMKRVPLLIATCVQLAAKMCHSGAKVNATIIRSKLIGAGVNFTVDEINATEFEVYSTLEFKIPLWTNVETAQLLALEVGITSENFTAVAATVDLAEFKREFIEQKVRDTVKLSTFENKRSRVCTLHLAAGAVVAVARVLHLPEPEPAARLAELTRAPLAYVKCIGDVICTIILDSDDPPAKRRKTHV
ncbi:unnamed protein product, partial [Iphiclides podalirius]